MGGTPRFEKRPLSWKLNRMDEDGTRGVINEAFITAYEKLEMSIVHRHEQKIGHRTYPKKIIPYC